MYLVHVFLYFIVIKNCIDCCAKHPFWSEAGRLWGRKALGLLRNVCSSDSESECLFIVRDEHRILLDLLSENGCDIFSHDQGVLEYVIRSKHERSVRLYSLLTEEQEQSGYFQERKTMIHLPARRQTKLVRLSSSSRHRRVSVTAVQNN